MLEVYGGPLNTDRAERGARTGALVKHRDVCLDFELEGRLMSESVRQAAAELGR